LVRQQQQQQHQQQQLWSMQLLLAGSWLGTLLLSG
jgi:hypothetical protein